VLKILPSNRACPLCESRAGWPVWSEAGHRYLRCKRCGVIFSDLSETAYVKEQHNVWHEEDTTPDVLSFYGEARARAHHAFLERHLPRGQCRLLDVGCGLGFFLSRAQDAGWRVIGCEPSRHWAEASRARVGPNRVLIGTADHPELSGERFDLVTVWDVIEHVFYPLPLLRRLRSLLTPDGRLFIRTPNLAYVLPVYALRRTLLRHPVELGPTNHVVYFTAFTMRRALERAGLQPVDWTNFPPPQVTTDRACNVRLSGHCDPRIALKNRYARVTARLAGSSRGRLVLSPDLDVLAVQG
jgi:2-polyprenyl-3-methyl-5-hydroxy-6-metoxy-1,4-benzoquinol methylase